MNEFKQTVYQKRIIKLYKGHGIGCSSKTIHVNKENGVQIGYLKAIDLNLHNSEEIINNLIKWRMMYADYFFTKFNVTYERTYNWVTNIVVPDISRILFLVYDLNNNLYGHYGISGICIDEAEIDNVIHGEKGGPSRLFFYVEISIMKFCFKVLKVKKVVARIFSNNFSARMLHESAGMKLRSVKSLKIVKINDDIKYEQAIDENDSNTDLKLYTLEINDEEFYEWINRYK